VPFFRCFSLQQLTFQWGCGNYSGFGDGGAFDSDGVGDNVPLEISHPYEANGIRSGMTASFQ